MRKKMGVLLVAGLCMGLTACSSGTEETTATATTAAEETTAAEAEAEETTAAEAESEETEAAAASGDPISVCIVYTGNLGDKSYNDSCNEGAQRAVEDFGVELRRLEGTTAADPDEGSGTGL